MCDAQSSLGNGSGIFVVRRHEKMKFAFQRTEIIYSGKGGFFFSCLTAIKAHVIKYVSAESPNDEFRCMDDVGHIINQPDVFRAVFTVHYAHHDSMLF